MAARPVIGISCNGKGKDPKRYTLPRDYVQAVFRAGGRTLVLPPDDKDAAGEALEGLDALILSGGGDIEAHRFGQEPHPANYGLDAERDVFELALARAARARNLPTLAICRGIQIVNVALGGDLIQHLPDVVADRVHHRGQPGESVRHGVRIAAGSRLSDVCGGTDAVISSCHHQAPRTLGEGVRAVAWAEDETVEGIEVDGWPEMLAVQWHPEETAMDDGQQQRLFGWLGDLARARRR
jgi:putative glutamine amidotransferase